MTTGKQVVAGAGWSWPTLLTAGSALLGINHDLQKFFGALNLHRKMDKLQS